MKRVALISCHDKTNLYPFVHKLGRLNYKILSTGGTYDHLEKFCFNERIEIERVEDVTKFPEILNGRVKTLHPNIFGGILANTSNEQHCNDISTHHIPLIDLVVVNLYPFWDVTSATTIEKAIELIDIGGVSLLRAAAKNYDRVTVFSSFDQYDTFPDKIDKRKLAASVFRLTSQYDQSIARFFEQSVSNTTTRTYEMNKNLKYGCNPHQRPAGIYTIDGYKSPFDILNGDIGYINVMDMIGCWGLCKELQSLTNRDAACSFKHTSPAGAAVSVNWESLPLQSQRLLNMLYGLSAKSSPAVNAYVRSRNADPLSSFGDFIGFSGIVDIELAKVIRQHVSDGIVAAGYTPEALEVLKQKKKGAYVIVKANLKHTVPKTTTEFREYGTVGLAVMQLINNETITESDMTPDKIVTENKNLPDFAKVDLVVANASLKYAQSNNVACATNGQLIGMSAGQQSRVHSVRLACSKAQTWLNRHREDDLKNLESIISDTKLSFQDKINASTQYSEKSSSNTEFQDVDISLASDAFFPFSDNIDELAQIRVKYITQAGGSLRDNDVIAKCDHYGITMVFTGKRIFTH